MLFHPDRGIMEATPKQRVQKEIACKVWMSASGIVTPLMFKMPDEDNVIQTFDKIIVNFFEKKEYVGVPSYEYHCSIIINGFMVNVILQFFPETLKWYLLEE